MELSDQDKQTYLAWGIESPLWEQRQPTSAEWQEHLLLGSIVRILAHTGWHRRDANAELYNLHLTLIGTPLASIVLKYMEKSGDA